MATEITRQEYDVLLEAMEAWEAKGMAGRVMGSMMSAMLCRSDEERAAVEEKLRQEEQREKEEQRQRKERSVMLRAKLISLRDSLDADRILEDARGGGDP